MSFIQYNKVVFHWEELNNFIYAVVVVVVFVVVVVVVVVAIVVAPLQLRFVPLLVLTFIFLQNLHSYKYTLVYIRRIKLYTAIYWTFFRTH